MTSYINWHIPLASKDVSLRVALESLQQVRSELPGAGVSDQDSPSLMDKLAGFDHAELDSFKELDQLKQDAARILLGRGCLPMDDIFVTGFTLGSIKKMVKTEQSVYAFVAKYLVPDICDFNEQEMQVFKDAIRLSFISNCSPLDQFDFNDWLDQPVATIRDAVGVEEELLHAYYAVEKLRNPSNQACQRLLPAEQQIVAF